MPEVVPPERRVPFREKLLWTAIVLVAYLLMTEIPIFGVARTSSQSDPYFYLRVIFASSRGSLMELGIQPIVTAGLITQLLGSSGLVQFDNKSTEDRGLLAGATKFATILMTTVLALAYLLSGAYGTDLSLVAKVAIFAQLFSAGLFLMLLDELLQKGWGLGSGISLFIAAGVAQKIFWDLFSPLPYEENGNALGSIIAYFQSILRGESPLTSFISRSTADAPTMLGLIITIGVFVLVTYLQALRVEIPISYAKYRGFRGRYPVNLLYVSNLPLILVSSLFMDIIFFVQIIMSRFNPLSDNVWLNWLGTFDNNQPVGGLVYYLTSPRNLSQFLGDPIRAMVYALMIIGLCGLFALIWLQVSGMDPASVAQQLVDSGLQIPGFRRSVKPIQSVLDRYIPTVAVLGGLIVGVVSSFSDFFGAYGTGTGILLTVGIVYQYYQTIAKEQASELYPLLRRFVGEE
jgi:preprotein translocase SecY subunit